MVQVLRACMRSIAVMHNAQSLATAARAEQIFGVHALRARG